MTRPGKGAPDAEFVKKELEDYLFRISDTVVVGYASFPVKKILGSLKRGELPGNWGA